MAKIRGSLSLPSNRIAEANVDRRERLRKLALETIDLAKDPYILRNHLGGLECRLCLTLHTNEGSYLAHTQGKKHQTNLARRAAKDAKDSSLYQSSLLAQQAAQSRLSIVKKQFIKIGSPGYQVTKVRDPLTGQLGLLFQIHYPQIAEGVKPRHRFMSSFEQHVETADRAHQYLLIAAEPYQTIAFKLQSQEIDNSDGKSWHHWDLECVTCCLFYLYGSYLPCLPHHFHCSAAQKHIACNSCLPEERRIKFATFDRPSVQNYISR
ncbi:hypothetical protein VP01_863g4 [Puccinia sorghi]|uniref:Matrin-type domain-containing protein n=1 Tax=Puccinia sorghi TaxID=27349 RepID=A0A0L6UAZ7_9BASI|nr:hypothetical protein VP01_863g4 [Puccinia sorghi]